MIKLEITVQPKTIKYLEFSQSLESMKPNLEKLCDSLLITEEDSTFSIIAKMKTIQQLTNTLRSNELAILSGAIKTLGEKSEVIIHGIGNKKKGTDLREIRLNYSKTKQEITNQ